MTDKSNRESVQDDPGKSTSSLLRPVTTPHSPSNPGIPALTKLNRDSTPSSPETHSEKASPSVRADIRIAIDSLTPNSPTVSVKSSTLKRPADNSQHHAKRPKETISETISPASPGDSFPWFNSGEVCIATKLGDHGRMFQLHRSVLKRNSTWFRNTFAEIDNDTFGTDAPVPLKYHFALGGEAEIPILVRHTAEVNSSSTPFSRTETQQRPNQPEIKSEPQSDDLQFETIIKLEGRAQSAHRKASHVDISLAYSSLFRTYYNLSPDITTTNIQLALVQSELLIEVAQIYDSVHLIRPHIGNIFSQFRQKLYIAIKDDPPRWLRLSITLESPSIFAEALIHLVGSHPAWPWRTRNHTIPGSVLKVIKKKADDLNELCAEVERDLFLNSIQAAGGGPTTMEKDFEGWCIVQVFRDWYCSRLNAIISKAGDQRVMERGRLYRIMRRGGDAYLPYDEVLASMRHNVKSDDWVELADDLKILKEYAKDTVHDLCKNELMLDVDAHNIGYLTCVDVDTKDFPWVTKEGDSVLMDILG